MPKTYTLTITLEGVTRHFQVDETSIQRGRWNDVIEDMLDTITNAKDF